MRRQQGGGAAAADRRMLHDLTPPERLHLVWFNASDVVQGGNRDQGPQLAFDGNLDSKWHTATNPAWIAAALPRGQVSTLARVEFHMAERAWSARWPHNLTVSGSHDKKSWQPLWSAVLQWDGTTAISVPRR